MYYSVDQYSRSVASHQRPGVSINRQPYVFKQLVQPSIKWIIKAEHYWAFVSGTHRFPRSRPVMRKAFPCRVVVKRLQYSMPMMTSSNGNIFRVTGPFVRGIHLSTLVSLTEVNRVFQKSKIFELHCGLSLIYDASQKKLICQISAKSVRVWPPSHSLYDFATVGSKKKTYL